MRSLAGLFGRSPFVPLKNHMDLVAEALVLVPALFDAIDQGRQQELVSIAEEISEKEHLADVAKNDMRNHLPRSLFLPIARSQLLTILTIQDSLADTAEDIARLVTLKELSVLPSFREPFFLFLEKNLTAFTSASTLVQDFHELFESSFGGREARKVKEGADRVAFLEHEADLLQHALLEKVYAVEGEMTFGTFYLWQRIFEKICAISNLAENLANKVQTTIEVQ